MGSDPRAPGVTDATVPDQDAVNGRGGRHLGRRVRFEQELMKLAGTPAPGFAELEDLANHRGGRGMRALLGPVGAIGEAVGPEPGIAIEPLIAGLAADAVAPTELGEGSRGVLGIEHEALALVHG
jgi:hypothetical protein